MNKYVAIENITEELTLKRLAGITLWNRLEARPRTNNFNRALKAEVRDALWMLTKQWQMGEFLGDDAGSPVFAKMYMGKTKLTKYVPANGSVQAFDEAFPLEAKVEKRRFPFDTGTSILSLDLRLQMGRHWLKLISSFGATVASEFIAKYKITLPNAKQKADAPITAHKEAWQQFNAVAGRCMDGAALYFYLKSTGTPHAYDGIASITTPAQFIEIDTKAEKFKTWFEKLYYQPAPAENDAWIPQQLEYQFACSAPVEGKEKVMVADEYYHGHMDWYNLDIDPKRNVLPDTGVVIPADLEEPVKRSFVPTPLSFDGMPNIRWWTFEDGRTNFGNISPSTTDLGKLLFMEFTLVYANDWFLLPLTLPAGSIATIKGLSVTNVFGERLWIEAAGKGLDDDWQKWSLFTLNTKGNVGEQTDNSLLVLPTVSKIQEGKPIEEVHLLRDEVANMVWGIEHIIPLASGKGKQGSEAARELKSRYQQIVNKAIDDGLIVPVEKEYKADLRYEVMNTVPENWIPFIPARVEKDIRSIRLQRAAMPRILEGDAARPKVEPRTTILREGLDAEIPATYFINEEEITRAGTNVYQSFQRTRWYNGQVVTWLGMRKRTGKGEGASRLAFDQGRDVKKK
jgi:hypothetical protein